jgi:hypothetical protein
VIVLSDSFAMLEQSAANELMEKLGLLRGAKTVIDRVSRFAGTVASRHPLGHGGGAGMCGGFVGRSLESATSRLTFSFKLSFLTEKEKNSSTKLFIFLRRIN